MSWSLLLLAGALEVGATTLYRYTDHMTKLGPSAALLVLGLFSFLCLQRAVMLGIEIGTAYAVWTGIGAAGTVLVGVLYFGETTTALRLSLLIVLIGSIAGLQLTSSA